MIFHLISIIALGYLQGLYCFRNLNLQNALKSHRSGPLLERGRSGPFPQPASTPLTKLTKKQKIQQLLPPPPIIRTLNLKDLGVEEVSLLFDSLHIAVEDRVIYDNQINGEVLYEAVVANTLKDHGIYLEKSKLEHLSQAVNTFHETGVDVQKLLNPLEMKAFIHKNCKTNSFEPYGPYNKHFPFAIHDVRDILDTFIVLLNHHGEYSSEVIVSQLQETVKFVKKTTELNNKLKRK